MSHVEVEHDSSGRAGSAMTRHSPTTCPDCGTRIDASTSITEGGPVPKPGDLTLCAECQSVLTFTSVEPLVLERAERADLEALPPETRGRLAHVAAWLRRRKRGG